MPYPEGMHPRVEDVVRFNGEEKTVIVVAAGFVKFPRTTLDPLEYLYAKNQDLELVARPDLPAEERYASGETPEAGDRIRHVRDTKGAKARVDSVMLFGVVGVSYLGHTRHCTRKANKYELIKRK